MLKHPPCYIFAAMTASDPVSRRTALAQLGAAVIAAPAILRGRYRGFPASATEYSARCVKLMEESVVVDLLNQFRFQDFAERPPRIDRWLNEPGSLTAADADLYRSSGMTALALGHGASSYDAAVRYVADWNGFLAGYSDWFTRIDDAGDFARAKSAR